MCCFCLATLFSLDTGTKAVSRPLSSLPPLSSPLPGHNIAKFCFRFSFPCRFWNRLPLTLSQQPVASSPLPNRVMLAVHGQVIFFSPTFPPLRRLRLASSPPPPPSPLFSPTDFRFPSTTLDVFLDSFFFCHNDPFPPCSAR